MPVVLFFPDGTELKGASATDALLRWGRIQWTPTEDVDAIKSFVSDRAWAWSRSTVDPLLPDDEFLTAVDASGLCVVLWSPEKATPKARPHRAHPSHGTPDVAAEEEP